MIDRFFVNIDEEVKRIQRMERLEAEIKQNKPIPKLTIRRTFLHHEPEWEYPPRFMTGRGNCCLTNAEIKESFKELIDPACYDDSSEQSKEDPPERLPLPPKPKPGRCCLTNAEIKESFKELIDPACYDDSSEQSKEEPPERLPLPPKPRPGCHLTNALMLRLKKVLKFL